MSKQEDGVDICPDQIQSEARAWLRRLTSGEATEADAQGFRRWRSSSALHETAYAEARRWWNSLDPAMARLLEQNPKLAARMRRGPRRTVATRRAFLGTAIGAAAAAGVAAVAPLGLWPSAREWGADFRTATGEQRQVRLADGRVTVEMNTQTAIARRYADGRTVGMELITGEAAIDVPGAMPADVSMAMPAAARAMLTGDDATVAAASMPAPIPNGRHPALFSVVAGNGTSIASGGRFQVRHSDLQTCVSCQEGEVRIDHPSGTRTVPQGHQVIYDARSLGQVAAADAAAVSAWREGILMFRDTPLAQVVDEINRYRPGRVVLLADSLAQRRVSGRFPIAELDTVLLQIQQSYDLTARALPGGLLLLS